MSGSWQAGTPSGHGFTPSAVPSSGGLAPSSGGLPSGWLASALVETPAAARQVPAGGSAARPQAPSTKRPRHGEPPSSAPSSGEPSHGNNPRGSAGPPLGSAGASGASAGQAEELEVHMAIAFHGKRIGVAVYTASTGDLQVMEMPEDGHEVYNGMSGSWSYKQGYQSLQLIKYQCQPDVIYVSSKSEQELVDAARAPLDDAGGDPREFNVLIEKAGTFKLDHALLKLQALRVPGVPQGIPVARHLGLLGNMINLSQELQVVAAGALISCIQRETDSEHFSVSCIAEFTVGDYLMMDLDTYDALQIFEEERHPSAMGIGNSKEGLSVYALLSGACTTVAGKRLMKLWLDRPIVHLETIKDRLDSVEFLLVQQDLRGVLMRTLRGPLKQLDVARTLHHLTIGPYKDPAIKCWQQLLQGLESLLLLRAEVEDVVAQDPLLQHAILRKAVAIDAEAIADIRALIHQVLDFDQDLGDDFGRTMVHFGVYDRLDEVKSDYQGLPSFLTEVAREELKRIPQELRNCYKDINWSISYIPNLGYLMRIEGQRLQEDLAEVLSDYQFAFETNTLDTYGAYYFTGRTTELNNELGDVFHKVQDMEAAIVQELADRVLENSAPIRAAAGVAAELDCLLALAACARSRGLVRPELTEENVLDIRGGRHILSEQIVEQFVPNDTAIGAARNRVHVITGPNFSGKSVYMKQVAIITVLAHVGSFVPAEHATIGLTDRIFTRIGSTEAVSRMKSAFMNDLQQVSFMLHSSTPRSLCLIDEYGKGTLTSDGVGLLCATLNSFARRATPPKVLACTHFAEVFDTEYIPRSPKVAFHTMSVLDDPARAAAPGGARQIVLLYKLVPGCVTPSFGVHCARIAGVRGEVLERAEQVIELQGSGRAVARVATIAMARRDARCVELLARLRAFDAATGDLSELFGGIEM